MSFPGWHGLVFQVVIRIDDFFRPAWIGFPGIGQAHGPENSNFGKLFG